MINSIKPYILIYRQWNCKNTFLFCLSFRKIESIAFSIRNDIAEAKLLSDEWEEFELYEDDDEYDHDEYDDESFP